MVMEGHQHTANAHKSSYMSGYIPEFFDAVVVLGGGVYGDKVSSCTCSRLATAVNIILCGLSQNLILTGSEKEIELMYKEAITLGLNPEQIFKCEPSKTTIGNAFYAKLKIMELGFKRIILVTSHFHMERALAIFKQMFGDNYDIHGYSSHECVSEEILKREETLRAFIPLLNLFKKGDHETIMGIARALGIEE
ncbi:MAG: YdcF family protein [Candidatus Bathyarchaeia archaeon]